MSKIKLYEHQEQGIAFALREKKCILAHDMGLGKSLTALIAYKRSGCKNLYIFCPARLKENWAKEFQKWDVVDYTNVYSFAKLPNKVNKNSFIIIDEAHNIKNPKSQRTRNVTKLCKSAEYVIMLTGTPMPQGCAFEMYPLLKITGAKISQGDFKDRFCKEKTIYLGSRRIIKHYGVKDVESFKMSTQKKVQVRIKEECLDLPDKTRIFIYCENVPKKESDKLNRIKNNILDIKEKIKKGSSYQNEDLKSDLMSEIANLRMQLAICKIRETVMYIDRLHERGEKVIVFTKYRKPLSELLDNLSHLKVSCVHGDIKNSDRMDVVNRFQNNEIDVLLCTYGAGGEGLTLTNSCNMVLLDRPFTNGMVRQAEDRINRIGQDRRCFYAWMQYKDLDVKLDNVIKEQGATVQHYEYINMISNKSL